MKKPQIIIVDDHQIFRQSLKSILSVENIATVIGEASNGAEFLSLLAYTRPDLVLMDLDMPEMNGLEASQRAFEIMPNLKIIAFTMFGDEEYFLKMIELGVKGYILKSSDISELEKAIQIVLRGEIYFSNKQFKKTENSLADKHKKKLVESHSINRHNHNHNNHNDLYPKWY